jgi:hypothetical protein
MKTNILALTALCLIWSASSMAQSCGLEAAVTLSTELWGSEISFTVSDDSGVLLQGSGFEDFSTTTYPLCLDSAQGCLTLEMVDSFGDGWNGGFLSVSVPILGLDLGTFSLEDGVYQAISFGDGCETNVIEQEGCTDPFAFNFDPFATVDDGSCSYDCECDDVYEPVCAYDYTTGEYITFSNACEAQCAFAWVSWYGDCSEQPIYGCTNPDAVNYNDEATQDDGSCLVIPTCGADESTLLIEVNGVDSLADLGLFVSVYWNLTDANGAHVDLVYDYTQFEMATAYGCLADGCYTFALYDYGWAPESGSVDVSIDDETTTYSVPEGQYEAAFAIGVNAEDCEVVIPVYGCTDTEAVNYNPAANQDDGSCVVIPTCSEDESSVVVEINSIDSLADNGFFWNIYWTLTDDNGMHVELVYDYTQYELSTAYGCLADGCYNFFVVDYGWEPFSAGVDVTIDGLTTTYNLGENQFEAAYAIGVNTEDCEVTIPVYGCTDAEAMNFNPDANTEDGSCLYPCDCPDVYEPVCAFDHFANTYVTFNNACEAECWNAWISWEGDCSEVPVYGCTNPEALNYNPEATTDDGSCAVIPVCNEDESQIVIQSVVGDSLNDFGIYTSLYWSLTTDMGLPTDMVYSYTDVATISYGCLSDGCYNFYLYDYGWTPGTGSANVTIDGTTTSYSLNSDEYSSVFALGVNTDSCEVTIPGCTDPEAFNYDPYATTDNGTCQYPFICDNGIHAFAYLFAGGGEMAIDIVGDNGDIVFTQNSSQSYGYLYADLCLEPGVCYTAYISGSPGTEGTEFGSGQFGVGTYGLDLVFAEWPMDQASWEVEFSVDGTCGPDNFGDGYGCTDPTAWNYDPFALFDDGSCVYNDQCENMNEVTLMLDGGDWPGEVLLYLMTEDDEMLMALDGFTGSMTGCLADGCYKVEMHDSFGDGWNGAWAEMMVNGESVGTMSLSEGSYESTYVGVNAECTADNDGGSSTPSLVSETEPAWSFDVWPNPGTLSLNIQAQGRRAGTPLELVVLNAQGQRVASQALPVAANGQATVIETDGWAPGVYIVRLSQQHHATQRQWIKLD